jgi:hypothetical protein
VPGWDRTTCSARSSPPDSFAARAGTRWLVHRSPPSPDRARPTARARLGQPLSGFKDGRAQLEASKAGARSGIPPPRAAAGRSCNGRERSRPASEHARTGGAWRALRGWPAFPSLLGVGHPPAISNVRVSEAPGTRRREPGRLREPLRWQLTEPLSVAWCAGIRLSPASKGRPSPLRADFSRSQVWAPARRATSGVRPSPQTTARTGREDNGEGPQGGRCEADHREPSRPPVLT